MKRINYNKLENGTLLSRSLYETDHGFVRVKIADNKAMLVTDDGVIVATEHLSGTSNGNRKKQARILLEENGALLEKESRLRTNNIKPVFAEASKIYPGM